jgi:hypothetical protein
VGAPPIPYAAEVVGASVRAGGGEGGGGGGKDAALKAKKDQ